jgi:hypothetical protein
MNTIREELQAIEKTRAAAMSWREAERIAKYERVTAHPVEIQNRGQLFCLFHLPSLACSSLFRYKLIQRCHGQVYERIDWSETF